MSTARNAAASGRPRLARICRVDLPASTRSESCRSSEHRSTQGPLADLRICHSASADVQPRHLLAPASMFDDNILRSALSRSLDRPAATAASVLSDTRGMEPEPGVRTCRSEARDVIEHVIDVLRAPVRHASSAVHQSSRRTRPERVQGCFHGPRRHRLSVPWATLLSFFVTRRRRLMPSYRKSRLARRRVGPMISRALCG